MMDQLIWTCARFSDLTAEELYEILRLRAEVFVVEQDCVYLDLDDKDQASFHLCGRDKEDGSLCAYTRLVPPDVSYPEPSIGRVVTALAARGKRLGKELMTKSITKINEIYPDRGIRISAQLYLLEFYKSFGFEPCGEPYDEDGIPHVEMLKR